MTRLFDPVTRRYVWGTPGAVFHTQFDDDVDLDANDRLVPQGWVGSRGPINTGWQLTIALRKFGGYTEGRDVYPFYYDWRRPARENAQRLRAFVANVREAHGGAKVDLVTHSAGAIVATTFVKLEGGADDVEHLVMIAPVLDGTIEAFRVFVRPERFIRRTFAPSVVATWPFVFELLPENGHVFLHDDTRDLWNANDWPAPIDATRLAAARRFRDELRDAPMPRNVRVTTIAGDCVPTAQRILARADGTFVIYPNELRDGEQPLARELFAPGDGTAVAHDANVIVCDGHQGIAADPTVHRTLVRLLREE